MIIILEWTDDNLYETVASNIDDPEIKNKWDDLVTAMIRSCNNTKEYAETFGFDGSVAIFVVEDITNPDLEDTAYLVIVDGTVEYNIV